VKNEPAEPLKCVECGRVQPAGARGCKAYLTTDEDEPAEAVVHLSLREIPGMGGFTAHLPKD
jgi:hypothetical protein